MIETTLLTQADKIVGLFAEDPLSGQRRQHFVDKFLYHVRDVLRLGWKSYQLYGPDQLFFRVTGQPDSMQIDKGDPMEDFDIVVSFDTQNNDPESIETRLGQLVQLLAIDKNGKLNVDALIEIAAAAIDPVLADATLMPSEAGSELIVKQVFDDIKAIYSGIETGARPQGAQVALSVLQQYAQQPDIAARLQNDEAFAGRLQKYAEQYQFMLQQMQNAEIGKIGTSPAAIGGMNTQGIKQS